MFFQKKEKEKNLPQIFFKNNTIPDGGVAPHHLLKLDGVTGNDLKGQK